MRWVAAVGSCACGSGPATTSIGTLDPNALVGPQELSGIQVDVALSRGLRCGLDEEGRASCWSGTPHPDFLIERYVDLSGSDEQVCGVTASGLVQCSGNAGRSLYQSSLQLPQGARLDALSAGPVLDTWCVLFDGRALCDQGDFDGETGLIGVTRGASDSCAWRDDGTSICRGEGATTDAYGGEPSFPSSARIVDGVTWPHVCAVRTDDALQCFSAGLSPLSTPPFGRFSRVWAATDHACARTGEGALACWGTDGAALAPPGTGWGEVSVWGVEACAVTSDSRIQCWTL
ncbi:MAG: hypothetical protein KTR31_38735 [Myxococcales bacterium]|nr:hypothetical protein [Myxococcales bacterium]